MNMNIPKAGREQQNVSKPADLKLPYTGTYMYLCGGVFFFFFVDSRTIDLLFVEVFPCFQRRTRGLCLANKVLLCVFLICFFVHIARCRFAARCHRIKSHTFPIQNTTSLLTLQLKDIHTPNQISKHIQTNTSNQTKTHKRFSENF